MKRHLEALLSRALIDAIAAGELGDTSLPPLALETPTDPAFGDLASNVAMVLARPARRPPRVVAERIVAHLRDPEGWLATTEIAGPGFINFRFAAPFWHLMLRNALASGEAYGRSETGAGRRVQVEFVSANPTGPLHIGHGRGAVIGDVTARLLEAVGCEVEREYYVNDAGRQMEILGRSTFARYRQRCGQEATLPEDGYPGEYLVEIADQLYADVGEGLLGLPLEQAVARCREFAGTRLLAEIQDDLARFAIRFDRFVSERALRAAGTLDRALAALPADLLYRQDGALFFRTTQAGDEKDRAVIRGTGEPTYFGGDAAHYYETVGRGFTQLINVLGADHHGYVARLRALVGAFGFDPTRLQVLLVQLVQLTRGGEPVRMGKRAGEFVTLREVLDEVGADAARFFFLLRKVDSQLEFDLALAKKQGTDNPVFYVQYAHARIASVLRQATEAGLGPEATSDMTPLDAPEFPLVRLVASYPDVVESAARELEPHRVVFFALELAGAFHRYYNQHRILTDDQALSRARLAVVACVQQVLRSALGLAGVSAPERM